MSTAERSDLALDDVIRLIPQGGVRDPEVLRRIQERSAKIRERIGPTDNAVELIRETRDEE
jgi:hypothetical protein